MRMRRRRRRWRFDFKTTALWSRATMTAIHSNMNMRYDSTIQSHESCLLVMSHVSYTAIHSNMIMRYDSTI